MATTKLDLLTDVITDALIDFDLRVCFAPQDGDDEQFPEPLNSDGRGELVNAIMELIADSGIVDENAQKQDFTIKVVMDKKIDTATEYGEVTPTENTKESEVL